MPNFDLSSFSGRQDISIVSPTEGTTRDIVETLLDVDGFVVRICDTAGLRSLSGKLSSHELIEEEGIRRTVAK